MTVSNINMTYADGTSLNGSSGFTTSGLLGSDVVSSVTLTTNASLSGSSRWNVGTWSITPSAASGSGLANYSITYDPGSLVVSPKSLNTTGITASPMPAWVYPTAVVPSARRISTNY
ncbi:MAG TPA: MBG domain-containing protein [Pirellulales bacterium]|nr:MBG domain-containing protein [Pirellulales bacterium]